MSEYESSQDSSSDEEDGLPLESRRIVPLQHYDEDAVWQPPAQSSRIELVGETQDERLEREEVALEEENAVGAEEDEEREEGHYDYDDEYRGEYDISAIDESFSYRVEYFLHHVKITNIIGRKNVEACVLIEAGSRVSDSGTFKTPVRNSRMLTEYTKIMEQLPRSLFCASDNVRDEMCRKLHSATRPLDGGKLWTKYQGVKREIGKEYENSLPQSLHADLASGQSLRDKWDAFIAEKYRNDPSNVSIYVIIIVLLFVNYFH